MVPQKSLLRNHSTSQKPLQRVKNQRRRTKMLHREDKDEDSEEEEEEEVQEDNLKTGKNLLRYEFAY